MKNVLVQTQGLTKLFPYKKTLFGKILTTVHAVEDVTLGIREKETLGLVGESGSGKSTLGRLILRLIPATRGSVYYKDTNILEVPPKQMLRFRKKMQIIFQDPYGSLNPRMTVEQIICEGMDEEKRSKKRERCKQLLQMVSLQVKDMYKYPHQFSGGQRQRISIARALAPNPEFIVADEPVSSLDVIIQAQILELFQKLKRELKLTYLFISHDLSVVKYIAERIAVMYCGRIVEIAPKETLFSSPTHPYTKELLSAIPIPKYIPDRRRKISYLRNKVFDSANSLLGCPFYPRCKYATKKCYDNLPELIEIEKGHLVACHMVTSKHKK